MRLCRLRGSELNVQRDHVHLVVMIPPKLSVSELLGRLKGQTAMKMFKQFQQLRKKPYWGNHFWAKGYCVDTVGLDADMIRSMSAIRRKRRSSWSSFNFVESHLLRHNMKPCLLWGRASSPLWGDDQSRTLWVRIFTTCRKDNKAPSWTCLRKIYKPLTNDTPRWQNAYGKRVMGSREYRPNWPKRCHSHVVFLNHDRGLLGYDSVDPLGYCRRYVQSLDLTYAPVLVFLGFGLGYQVVTVLNDLRKS